MTSEDVYWGDNICQSPSPDHHRVYFQNLDGMKNDEDEIDLFISSMAQLHVDTVCWADPCLDFSEAPIRKKILTIFQNHFQRAKVIYSSSTLPATSTSRANGYQPGGSLSATTGRWAPRTNGKSLVDPSGMGRWSGLSFIGKEHQTLSIITAYRSPRQMPGSGFGFFDQQHALLLAKGHKQPNVRKQFIVDLTKFIQDLQATGHHILLTLDANETFGQDKHFGISALTLDCQLTDLHLGTHLYPPATYKYGYNRRIDFIFGSSKVFESVTRAGYNAFDNGVYSKHRGIFIDFNFRKLLGKASAILPATARVLNSENQVHVDAYLQHLRKYFADHKIRSRVSNLQSTANTMPTLQLKLEYDSIDRDITRGMLHAEQKTKKARGKYQWSPQLRAHGLLTRYWRLRLRLFHQPNKVNLTQQLHSIRNRLISLSIPCPDDDNQDYQTIKKRWKDELRELKRVRVIAYAYRQNHLQSTLQIYESMATDVLDAEFSSEEIQERITRLKKLIEIESLRQPFQSIRNSLSANQTGSISKLLIPNSSRNHKVKSRFCNSDGSLSCDQLLRMAQFDKESVTYATIIDPKAIEKELLSYNKNWFKQASATPFGHGKLYDLLGFDGLTPGGEAITAGDIPEYSGFDFSPEIETLLEELKKPSSVPILDVFISCDDFSAAIRKWKEKTSTSPSGRHLGHYKSALLDQNITRIHTDMINLPISYGFAPHRWCTSITPLIEKETGRPYLQRLRIIHLFEADYNLFLKIIFGRRMVAQAERLQLLNDQQYGSRPRRTTIDTLFLSRLGKDILRQTKTNSVHMDNDATGCYDRILISMGMLACRRLGVPVSALRCQADTLRDMHYAVKHAFGISEEQYYGTTNEPLFGTGQGSGASPAIWLALVVTLLNSFDRIAEKDHITGISPQDPWEEIGETWRMGAFVDDTNQVIADHDHSLTTLQLVEQMRKYSQLWEKLLFASGGALNLSKCLWTLQIWDWKNGRPFLRKRHQEDPILSLTSGSSSEHHIITLLSNDTAVKTLGVYLNSEGTFDVQTMEMKKKFEKMAARLQSSNLNSKLSKIYYQAYFIPSAKYSLPVTSHSTKQLCQIQSKFVAVTLTKMGYNRHYPRAVVFASALRMGVGLHDLYTEQGLSHIQSILDYVGTEHKVGKVMIVSLRTLQVEAGVTFDLLKFPRKVIPYLTSCWLVTLRTFCAQHDIKIQVKLNRLPKLTRLHDQSLMEVAQSMGFKRQELQDINLIRLYLKVTVLSDIASACGTTLHPHIWRGYPIPDRESSFTFPRQQAPTPIQKRLWKKLLRHFLVPTATSKALVLTIPLGVWYEQSNMIWGAMIWQSTLYRRNPFLRTPSERYISVHFPKKTSKNALSLYYDSAPDWFAATIPRLASPADLNGSLIFTARFSETEFSRSLAIPKTFTQWCTQLDKAESRLLSNVFHRSRQSENQLIRHLQSRRTIHIGTDGGKKRTRGSFSWIICCPDKKPLITNFGPVDGWSPCLSSLRSEATAISSVTIYMAELASYYDFDICCCISFFVDSTSAIANVKQLRDRIPTRRYHGNCDILTILQNATLLLQHYQLYHVHSHQTLPFDQLPFEAQLNTMCDRMATHQMQMQEDGSTTEISMEKMTPSSGTPIHLSYRGFPITSNYVKVIRKLIKDKQHLEYLRSKYNWAASTAADIAWPGIERCMNNSTVRQEGSTRSKIAHNWLHLGDQRARFTKGALHSDECPMCSLPEDFRHMLTCLSPRAQQHRYSSLQTLQFAIRTIPTSSLLIEAMKQWIQKPDSIPIAPVHVSQGPLNSLSCQAILHRQSDIGWIHIFRGFISEAWGFDSTIEDDEDTRESRTIQHTSKLVRVLQDFTLSVWKFRCKVLHENESATDHITQVQLNLDISNLYQVRDKYSDIIQAYFSKPLEDRLTDSIRTKQRWLMLAKLATSHSTATGTRQQRITTYFPPSNKNSVCTLRAMNQIPCSNSETNGILDLPTVQYTKYQSKNTLTQSHTRDSCTAQLTTHKF